MSTPFMSEIRLFSFNFAPKTWALCNGQLLPINQNQALFSLLGTTYGGDGRTTFGLPNLQGKVPIHIGNGHTLGETAGSAGVTLNVQQLPAHNHVLNAQNTIQTADENAQNPAGRLLAGATVSLAGGNSAPVQMYGPVASLTTLNPQAVANAGGSQPHNNMMPYGVLNYCIALQGIFPSRN